MNPNPDISKARKCRVSNFQLSMKKGLLIICCLTYSLLAVSQTYSANREKFVKEFQKVLSDYGKSENMDFVKKQLAPMLLEMKDFPEEYFVKMVETANLMESKKLKPFPEIYNYIFSVYSFVAGKQPKASYVAWHGSVDKLLDSRNIKKFEDFIELSAGFFSEGRIAESAGFKWYFIGGEYAFEFTDKPFIRFTNGKLMCLVENSNKRERDDQPYIDSIVVRGTSGVYDPVLKKWDGRGGTITWEKVGLPANQTYAELKGFGTSMKTSNLTCDTVVLKTPYFTRTITGQLSDRAFKINREDDKIYPQFISFEKRLKFNIIKDELDYAGGFSLQGASFVGVGTVKEPASLIVYKTAKPFMKIASQLVTVSPTKISSQNSKVCILIGDNDSIYHPGVDFIYALDRQSFEFTRGKAGVSQAPFSDSYHMVDMYVPKITWVKGTPDLAFTYDFGTSQEQRIARMESKNFYDSKLYDQLQGMEQVHPLTAIYNYSYKYDEYEMNEGKIASAMGKTTEQAKPIMLQLSSLGFISYDTEAKIVKINPKLIVFIQARAGKIDYDNLNFVSDMRPKNLQGYTPEQIAADKNLQRLESEYKQKTEARRVMPNFGSMSLANLEIKLDAVDQVRISDPQSTAVFPEGSQVTIRKNRNFEFKGWVNSGKVEVKASIANYNYEANKINLLKTETGLLVVRPLAEQDGKELIPMQSTFSGMVGEILVDAPNNRAGNIKTITDFPKLVVSNPVQIYYNQRTLYRGAYDSSRFYFTIAPFELDSLDNFREKTLRLKGELNSAGIFPKFKEELKIMPDYSFGFSTAAPAGGYDFYSTKAKYENKIILSNNGLQGAGKIDFVQSTSISKAFTFLPDSTIGMAEFVNRPVEAGVQFPDVESKEAFITYVPRSNILKASSTKTLLSFFKDDAKLNGTAIVSPNGMTGNGIMNFRDANLGSSNFKFERWEANADTSNFNLKNNYAAEGEEEDPLSFKTDNVKANVSFKTKKGEFKSNSGETTVYFPVNQYACKMDMFTWYMDQENIEMSSAEKGENVKADLDLAGPNFFSTHPKQDSLQFRAPKAKFDLRTKVIYCTRTEYIDVADARIFPDSMKVVIRKKAQMDPLLNSTIVANFITKYHRFTKADTKITARRAYTSQGQYPYYDADSTMTVLQMDKIGLDSSYQTVATGKVKSDENFKLSKQFDYYGDVKINAAVPLITFSGATRINHNCEKFPKNWMSFSAQVDPKNIQIPVSSTMKTLDGQQVTAGIVWRDSRMQDSVQLYPTFLSTLANPSDPIVMTASGLLQYNFEAKEFQIGSKEKLINRGEKGNFLALHTESCSLNGDGTINLGMDYGDITVDAVGVVNYNQASGQTSMNITARYNLPLDKSLMEGIATKINAQEGMKAVDFASTTLEQALVEWTDQKTADKIKSDYTIKAEVKKLPKELETGFVVTGIRLSSFDPSAMQENGLITNVESAAIVTIYEKPVMKYVPFKAFFQQNYSGNVTGDKFGFLINVPGGSDYYFDYAMMKREGEMKIFTGDETLEAALVAMKEDKRKSKNFRYESTGNRIFLSKFMRLFGNE